MTATLWFRRLNTVICWLAGLALLGCIMPKEKKAMQEDLLDSQTRIVKLEQALDVQLKDVSTKGDTAAKRIASTQANLDKFDHEMQKIRGEIDTLRIGVITGQLPGTSSDSEGSIASALTELRQRVEAIETAQAELLDAIKKAGIKKGATSKSPSRKAMATVDELQKAFDQKKFLHIVEDAPAIEKKSKGDDKTTVQYVYAESLFKLGKLRDAALKYNDFLDSKPAQEFVPKAKLRMGDCFRHLGDFETSKLYYEELVSEFPNSEEAKTANERLADMGSSTKKG